MFVSETYRVIAVSYDIKTSAVNHLVLSQYTRLADGRTDRRTDGQKELRQQYRALHYMQSHGKTRENDDDDDDYYYYLTLHHRSPEISKTKQMLLSSPCHHHRHHYVVGDYCVQKERQLDWPIQEQFIQ